MLVVVYAYSFFATNIVNMLRADFDPSTSITINKFATTTSGIFEQVYITLISGFSALAICILHFFLHVDSLLDLDFYLNH